MLDNKIPPPIIALFAALGIYFTRYFPLTIQYESSYALVVAIVFIVLGLLIPLVANLSFRKASTTINPLKPDSASALVTTGVFAYSRNPMYLGMLLILCGLVFYWSYYLSFFWVIAFFAYITAFQIKPEEQAMATLFAAEYEQYKLTTRRWL